MPLGETIGTAYVKVLADGTGFSEDVERQIRSTGPKLEKGGEENGKKFSRGFKKGFKGEFRDGEDVEKTMGRLTKRLEGMGGKIGKLFGKGSRNDLVNFFGSLIGGLAGLPALLTGGIGSIIDFGKQLKTTFSGAGGGIEGVGAALGELASAGLPGLVAALAVAGIAIAGFELLLGPLGAGIVLVSGLILALAGSLGFALVGALVAVGGALVPFAAAFGVAALAMSNLDKKSSFFKTLQSDWKGLQKTVQGEIFGKKQQGLENIHKLLKGIMPLITPVAHALGQLLDQVGKVASGKGFSDAMGNIGKAIAPMIGTLGGIFGNLGKALGEAFLIATPMIQEFLGWLSGVAQGLADSGKGGAKSPMADFLNRAWESAKKVLSVVDKVIKIIGTLLDAGKDTGDSIFQKLADWLQRGLDKLQEWKKDGTLKKFFDDAGRLGDRIGDVVNAVGDLIDALDTPTNRTMFIDLIGLIADLINAIAWVARAVDSMNGAFAKWAFMTGQNIDKVVGWYLSLPGKVRAIPGQIAGFFSGLADKIISGSGDLVTSFTTWVTGVVAAIPGIITQIVGFFSGLADKIWTGAGDIATSFATWLAGLPVAVLNAVDSIVLGFADLAGKIITGAGDLTVAFINWTLGLAGAAAQAAVNIVFGFANLAIRIFNAAGSLASAFGAWLSTVPGKLKAFVASLPGFFRGLPGKIIAAAGSIASAFGAWLSSLPGKARAIAGQIASAFVGLASKAIARAGSIIGAFASWVAGLPGKARQIAGQIASAFSGLATKAIAKAGSIVAAIGHWASGVGARASQVANDIVNAFRGLASRIVDAIGNIVPRIKMPSITIPHITPIVDKPKARGALVTSPQFSLIGEAGPEAVVPLNRPLSQVDPAVRMLSAIAQGKVSMGVSGSRPSRTIDVGGITINTPTENPRAVAAEVVAHMAAAAYI